MWRRQTQKHWTYTGLYTRCKLVYTELYTGYIRECVLDHTLNCKWNCTWNVHWTVPWTIYEMNTELYTGYTLDSILDCTWAVHRMYTGWYPGLYTALYPWSAHQMCPAVHRFAPNVSRCALGLYANCVPDVLAVLQLCTWTAHHTCSSCAPDVLLGHTPNVLQLCSRCIWLCSSCVQLCPEVSRCALSCILCTGLHYTMHWTVH